MDSIQNKISNLVVLEVAVAVPLRQTFDFLPPLNVVQAVPAPVAGTRVKVPFGARTLVGLITAIKTSSDYPHDKLKRAVEILDDDAVFDTPLWATLTWLSRYYLAPIGEVVDTALPVRLRQGKKLMPAQRTLWRLSEHGLKADVTQLNKAPVQRAIVERFKRDGALSAYDFKDESSSWRGAIAALLKKDWLEEHSAAPLLTGLTQRQMTQPQVGDQQGSSSQESSNRVLTKQQARAAQALGVSIQSNSFSCTLLFGVTGSGKTQVYFTAMQQVLEAGKQVLLLVPEIGLTPQLIARVADHFSCPVATLHSGMNNSERHLAWWHVRQANAKIVIGTRSAVFTTCPDLGLIVVDEEHDGSFKQQDGVRYHARDVAVYRAKQHNIPIILGSATPSLESLFNARQGKYQLLELTQRATSVQLPSVELIDLERQPSNDGLSPAMLDAISGTLAQTKQVMLFLNRRGYAPVLYCKECRKAQSCHRCDSNMTLHQRSQELRCHHCGYQGALQKYCASCNADALVAVGEGTQRIEEALTLRFPEARILRIDRDSTRRKGELASLLGQAEQGQADIILGTQLITKGHDFPQLGMVGILDADQGLYSTDFRASETLFQQILQVAGRAGRRNDTGRVFIQTHFARHPLFDWAIEHDFKGFAEHLLSERQQASYPPFGYFALLRAESVDQNKALQFLRNAKQSMSSLDGVLVMDAIPAPMERRAGKYRAQLLIVSQQRSGVNTLLADWLDIMTHDKSARKLASAVRWSVDIDPLDHY